MLTTLALSLLWVVAIVQSIAIVALVYQLAEIRRLATAGVSLKSKLPVGSVAPLFSAIDYKTKRPLHSSVLLGRRVVICFLNADCQNCRTLAFELSRISPTALNGLFVYYYADADSGEEVLDALASVVPVLLKDADEVVNAFQIEHFPLAISIDESWHVAGISYPIRATDVQSLLETPTDANRPVTLTQVAG